MGMERDDGIAGDKDVMVSRLEITVRQYFSLTHRDIPCLMLH
jgi:hypothetical protein